MTEHEEAAAELDRVPAVTRAVRLLEQVASARTGQSLSELARALDAPKSSLLNICAALVSERLLRRDEDGNYRLGLRVAEFARAQLSGPRRLTRIGVATQDPCNPFFVVEEQAIVEAAAARNIRTVAFNAEQSLAKQIAQLRELGEAGVDAVIVDAVDSNGVLPGIHELRQKGIHVIAVNTGVADCDASVTTDNVLAGQLIGRFFSETVPEGGRLAIVGGNPVTAVSDRVIGFLSAIREAETLRVVDRVDANQTETGGYEAAKALLARNRKLDGIFAINDPTAIGVAAALRDAGLTIPIASVDGSAAVAKMIEDRKYIVATAAQSPASIGALAVELAERLFSHGSLGNWFHKLPPVLITESNAKSYRPWR
ncbi:substrate-binding domain-containing protein [Inquilinus sp. OTU3971]|uniref:substrate-binding domain-containing protein n=1 Tax=Inquilinus sp. OTU3971 TaxID=3043855 RepID=UPI00313D9410